MSVKNTKRPIILKRLLLKSQGTGSNQNNMTVTPGLGHPKKLIKLSTIPLYREDVIFESKGESFLPGEYRSVTIINNLNNITNNSKTIAKCVISSGQVIEKTSDNLSQLIGQEAYNTLFYALCSVINQEYRIKAILSLLTVNKASNLEIPTAKPSIKTVPIKRMANNDKSCQTNETRLESKKRKDRRRIRKVLAPYVVKPDDFKPKKVTVDPYAGKLFISPETCTKRIECFIQNQIQTTKSNEFEQSTVKTESLETTDLDETVLTNTNTDSGSLPDLGYLQDDNSCDSNKTFSTLHSFKTIPDLLINPRSLVQNVDQHTKNNSPLILPNHPIMLMDGSVIRVPFKPEDDFHLATKGNLQYLDNINRKKLLLHQMQIDLKYCIHMIDEDGNLPIHLAVINDDIELLKRQCVVLKMKKQYVDIPASNGLTALKLSLFRDTVDATSILLHHGADPFLEDKDHSTCAHLAAELKTDHLSILLHHCKLNARSIISQHAEELQKTGWETKSDEELSGALLHYMCCTLYDKQGYTPLMLASKLGHYENVRLLLESAPNAVDLRMPNSGNTALFLAVAAACTVAAERGNKSKVVDSFRKTLEILLEYGADPSVENHCGSNVNLLLQEINCTEMSMLIANKVTCTKYFKGEMDPTKNFDEFILMKEGNNVSIKDIDIKKIKTEHDKKTTVKNVRKKHVNDIPVIKKQDNKPVKTENQVNKKPNAVENMKVNVNNIPVKKEQKNTMAIKIKQVNKKPVIVENILLKTPVKVQENLNAIISVDSNVNTKDFVIKPSFKMETYSSIKKFIWCPPKRKAEDETKDTKRARINK